MFKAQQAAKISWLFETEALQISAAEKPFLYTSGLIGPYYINTHFLCGGPETANEILSFIETEQNGRENFPEKICSRLEQVYQSHDVYRDTIDSLAALTKECLPIAEVNFVSGGQRRDWFFSPLLAKQLDKPCLYIYNDLSMCDESGQPVENLEGSSVLNAADLLTIGSSYTKKWVPALKERGAALRWSINGVDRLQGGQQNLKDAGVETVESLFSITTELFNDALDKGLIDEAQHSLVCNYVADPFDAMRSFLIEHPEFVDEAKVAENEKTRQRVQLLIDEDLYKLS